MPKHTPVPAKISKSKKQTTAARETESGHAIHIAIEQLARAIAQRHPAREKILLLGIANGGVTLARRLAAMIPGARPGVLDISFHRDDIGRHPIPKEFAPTHIPGDVNNATVILVDDVLQSGRTINAALNEVFDHGRPERVELAVLVDRGDRRLPIAANYTGIQLDVGANEKIRTHIDPADPALDTIEIQNLKA
ncbi:pyrimidine operon attenuation protein/uracil phosphoribosyltransferase [Ereboglobus sp. PH5-10]|uniref:bifunctional pyr operon transcriptional regulator/uracil phosphoribosyltransferase PyrR n=1 Tax=Ereboglobus sp. PH5-10 TaxID=2940629 RepID=UPI002406471E|nr:bifunctional pyr operon transcriptional regulator/uracil phosphoribosyltransferase PyrR [Ereboglobus sp. PH5-10]MDF9828108.1 pyrimidine operon attenuation protein/uracil phosphoribosyltransferase [Ereboglobus sp. PH5-10]